MSDDLTMLPSTAAERETFLAELRCRRLEALQWVYFLDFIGVSVQHRMVTVDGARSMLAETVAGPADE
ncbi:MAG: hypothetical protein ACOC9Q_00830 [bacterium]